MSTSTRATRRTLIARPGGLSDVLLAGPAVRAVAGGRRGQVPEIFLLCEPRGTPAARMLPGVRGVLTWSCPWDHTPSATASAAAPRRAGELLGLVLTCQPDEAILLPPAEVSPLPLALLLRLAGVPRIVGASVDGAGGLLDVRVRPGEDFPDDLPEPARSRRIVRAAGYLLPMGDDGRLRLGPTPPSSTVSGLLARLAESTDTGWDSADTGYLVVHPANTGPAQVWPASRFRELVSMLVECGFRVVVTGTAAERRLTAFVAGRDAVDLGGLTDLAALAGVLAAADAVICGDAGPAHLAAAVGTPVVSPCLTDVNAVDAARSTLLVLARAATYP